MIVVDTSVWIDFLRGTATAAAEKLDALLGVMPLAIGDLILTEVLQGCDTTKEEGVVPPMTIVLADAAYYTYHDVSERSSGWREFVRFGQSLDEVKIRFAQAELDADGFFSRDMAWLE